MSTEQQSSLGKTATGFIGSQRRRLSRWLVAIAEVVSGVAIGSAAGNIFHNESVAAVVKVVMPFVGCAIGLSTLLLDMRIDNTVKDQLRESREDLLGNVNGLLERSAASLDGNLAKRVKSLESLLPFFNFYLDSSMADPLGFRSRIVDDAVGRLRRLANGEIDLEDSLYYEWLTARLRFGVRTMRAINVRPLRVFETDPREEAFLIENHAAIERGAQVTRIYIIQRSELFDREARRILLEAYKSKVVCYVAWQEDLTPALLAEFRGGGLSIYDEEDIFWDRSFLRYSYVQGSGPSTELYAKLEASVFRAPHPKFTSLKASYAALFDQFVPVVLKVHHRSGVDAYCDVLRDLIRRSLSMPDDVRSAITDEIAGLESRYS